jgi:hypothetical protein
MKKEPTNKDLVFLALLGLGMISFFWIPLLGLVMAILGGFIFLVSILTVAVKIFNKVSVKMLK